MAKGAKEECFPYRPGKLMYFDELGLGKCLDRMGRQDGKTQPPTHRLENQSNLVRKPFLREQVTVLELTVVRAE